MKTRLLRLLRSLPLLILAPFLLAVSALALALTDLVWMIAGRARRPVNTRTDTRAASLVIPNWNGKDLLARFVPSWIAAIADHPGSEVLVVDNGSTDGSAAWLMVNYPQVRVLALPRNLGFGGGSNEGFRAARNEIVVLLNSDMRVEPDFLRPLLDGFTDDQVFAVSCQIFLGDPSKRREETGLPLFAEPEAVCARASSSADEPPDLRSAAAHAAFCRRCRAIVSPRGVRPRQSAGDRAGGRTGHVGHVGAARLAGRPDRYGFGPRDARVSKRRAARPDAGRTHQGERRSHDRSRSPGTGMRADSRGGFFAEGQSADVRCHGRHVSDSGAVRPGDRGAHVSVPAAHRRIRRADAGGGNGAAARDGAGALDVSGRGLFNRTWFRMATLSKITPQGSPHARSTIKQWRNF